MKKRDLGFFEKVLPVLLSTGIVFGMILCSGRLMTLYRDREQMQQLARAYLLEMETIGYLPVERLESLITALEECGLTNVALDGTSTEKVPYGATIYLEIKGKLARDVYFGIPLITNKKEAIDIPIHIQLRSTAKH